MDHQKTAEILNKAPEMNLDSAATPSTQIIDTNPSGPSFIISHFDDAPTSVKDKPEKGTSESKPEKRPSESKPEKEPSENKPEKGPPVPLSGDHQNPSNYGNLSSIISHSDNIPSIISNQPLISPPPGLDFRPISLPSYLPFVSPPPNMGDPPPNLGDPPPNYVASVCPPPAYVVPHMRMHKKAPKTLPDRNSNNTSTNRRKVPNPKQQSAGRSQGRFKDYQCQPYYHKEGLSSPLRHCLVQRHRVLVLMRGLPGSGKSTLAKYLKDATGVVCSSDDYFCTTSTSSNATQQSKTAENYHYDPSKLDDAHKWNLQRAILAMDAGSFPVIIDNTNARKWEMDRYVNVARKRHYEIHFVEPNTPWKWSPKECAKRNSHGVAKDRIKSMAEHFDHTITLEMFKWKSPPAASNKSAPKVPIVLPQSAGADQDHLQLEIHKGSSSSSDDEFVEFEEPDPNQENDFPSTNWTEGGAGPLKNFWSVLSPPEKEEVEEQQEEEEEEEEKNTPSLPILRRSSNNTNDEYNESQPAADATNPTDSSVKRDSEQSAVDENDSDLHFEEPPSKEADADPKLTPNNLSSVSLHRLALSDALGIGGEDTGGSTTDLSSTQSSPRRRRTRPHRSKKKAGAEESLLFAKRPDTDWTLPDFLQQRHQEKQEETRNDSAPPGDADYLDESIASSSTTTAAPLIADGGAVAAADSSRPGGDNLLTSLLHPSLLPPVPRDTCTVSTQTTTTKGSTIAPLFPTGREQSSFSRLGLSAAGIDKIVISDADKKEEQEEERAAEVFRYPEERLQLRPVPDYQLRDVAVQTEEIKASINEAEDRSCLSLLDQLTSRFPTVPVEDLESILIASEDDLTIAMTILKEAGYTESVGLEARRSSKAATNTTANENRFSSTTGGSSGKKSVKKTGPRQAVPLPVKFTNPLPQRTKKKPTSKTQTSSNQQQKQPKPQQSQSPVTSAADPSGDKSAKQNSAANQQPSPVNNGGKTSSKEKEEDGEFDNPTVVFDLSPVFCEQLQNLHAPVVTTDDESNPFRGEFPNFPASLMESEMLRIKLPLSLSSQIYDLWMATWQQNFGVDLATEEMMNDSDEFPELYADNPAVQEKLDAALARRLQDEFLSNGPDAQSSADGNSIADKLKLSRLIDMFPGTNKDVIIEAFRIHNCNLESTIRSIGEMYGFDNVLSADTLIRQSSVPKDNQFDDELAEIAVYDELRVDAQLHDASRREMMRRAREAYQKGNEAAASYYSGEAQKFNQRRKEANERASEMIVRSRERTLPANVLDLHGLHTEEAVRALKQKIATFTPATSGSEGKWLEVITGQGRHSRDRRSRIRPVVINHIKQWKLRYEETSNPGMIRVLCRP